MSIQKIRAFWTGKFSKDELLEGDAIVNYARKDVDELINIIENTQLENEKLKGVLEVYAHESNWSSCLDTEVETGEFPDVNGYSDTRSIQIDAGIDIVWCNNDEGKYYAQKVLDEIRSMK